jgi:hypothetical protein
MDEARRSAVIFRYVSVPDVLIATPRVIVQSLAPGTNIRDVRMGNSPASSGKRSAATCWRSCITDTSQSACAMPTRQGR